MLLPFSRIVSAIAHLFFDLGLLNHLSANDLCLGLIQGDVVYDTGNAAVKVGRDTWCAKANYQAKVGCFVTSFVFPPPVSWVNGDGVHVQ